jgi:hypothetical protein
MLVFVISKLGSSSVLQLPRGFYNLGAIVSFNLPVLPSSIKLCLSDPQAILSFNNPRPELSPPKAKNSWLYVVELTSSTV